MPKFTKAEREYIKGIVHNYSLQRWSDQDIVDYLHNEKKINITRRMVTEIRNRVQQQAETWYIGLRESRYKFIAFYKERLDSLLSYQSKLNEIIAANAAAPEIGVRGISELHRMEMSLFSLFKELPNFHVDTGSLDGHTLEKCWCPTNADKITHSKCRSCLTIWCVTAENQDWCPNPDCSAGIKGCHFQPYDEHYTWIQCPDCTRWFKRKEILEVHHCNGATPPSTSEDGNREVESEAWANANDVNDTVVKKLEPSKYDHDKEVNTEDRHPEPLGRPWTREEARRAAAKVRANRSHVDYVSY